MQMTRITGFGPGTTVLTEQGEIPVEWLDSSDRVLTRDDGFQPIVMIRRMRMTPADFAADPENSPVRLPADALGAAAPLQDLHVTGAHRLLLRSADAMGQGRPGEVIAPARAWADLGRAEACFPKQPYVVTQIFCAAHHLIHVHGLWAETGFAPDAIWKDKGTPGHGMDSAGAVCARKGLVRPCISTADARRLIERDRADRVAYMPDTVRKRAG